jgi:hypothetical protein
MAELAAGAGANGLEKLCWRVRFGDGRPDRVAVVFGVALIAGLVGMKLLGHPLFGVIGFAMILASTTEVWWGTAYEIDAAGAKATTGLSTTKIEWKEVRRVVRGDREVTLSPLAEDSRLAPFRGVTLRYGALGAEAVLAAIEKFRPDASRGEDVHPVG